ncbi:glycoside hydrolase family 2 protein [Actinocorallia sp. API 0066]|uniref:glycoside hydrolase family 2 protein n=1 Tax=Actinocorallia sp. API 0066 TaxID=2896846 RepID=UPI001E5476E7|nr:glycoside hydrolase family 2 protein [Actinocorallia sp. API 0066]MCD0449230.1 glycoside hydrolase family 2 protein [Actinocorallia sp. API 0066]
MSKQWTPVDRGWTVRWAGGEAPQGPAQGHDGPLPAEVPGCVHADLLAAGLIPDPYVDDNERAVAWVGRADWEYRTVLAGIPDGHERTELVFDGLDTVATVAVDGTVVGATRNMHRSYRFDVTGLAAGGAELTVRFTSAYTEAEAVRALVGERPNVYPEPFNYIRKMASGFGWDWGPTLVTAGMWRPVRIETWSTARIARVRPLVTVVDGTGRVEARVSVERTASGRDADLTARLTVAGRTVEARVEPGAAETVVVAEVPDARLWWPAGQGDQNLYPCEITLGDSSGGVLDTWSRTLGFRTVELDRSPDEHGTAFTLRINGRPVFSRGVNWIPDDALPARVTPERYRRRLEQAADAGINLVRIWGGGIYEDEAFYDACDELGLMVWQDFLFACAAYPEEQPLRGEVEAEARENVVRLAPHPSLVLWNGNNENLWGFRDWDWAEPLAGESWGEGYYLGVLPRIVAELDPTRPYAAGSPWSGSWDRHPNDPAHGTSHFWEVWNRRDYTDYLNETPRFAAEFGWQAPATLATIREGLPTEELAPASPGMLHHQKAEDGNGKLDRGLAHHFAPPETFDAWHYLTQVNQARAVATAVAHWRSLWPVCAGTVVWQLNDCWPVTSWAAIDGGGRPKPLYFELRRLYADRLVSFQRRDGVPVLAVDNQADAEWTATALVRRLGADGRTLAAERVAFAVPPRTVALLPVPSGVGAFGEPRRELLVVDADGLRDVVLGSEDRDFAFPDPGLTVKVGDAADGSFVVVVTAAGLARDLLLQADRLGPEAVADRGLVTLLPGESVAITVSGLAGAPAVEAVEAALFSVNAVQPGVGVAVGR